VCVCVCARARVRVRVRERERERERRGLSNEAADARVWTVAPRKIKHKNNECLQSLWQVPGV